MIEHELSSSNLDSIGSVLGLSSSDPLNTFAEIWYQVFLWNFFLNLIVYSGAAVVASIALRKHPLMRFFGVAVIACGFLTPITFGAITSSVLAFVFRTAGYPITPLWAMVLGAFQVFFGLAVAFSWILATL